MTDFLNSLADKLDAMAAEVKGGGWSTIHVEPMRQLANDCRREASAAKQAGSGALAALRYCVARDPGLKAHANVMAVLAVAEASV